MLPLIVVIVGATGQTVSVMSTTVVVVMVVAAVTLAQVVVVVVAVVVVRNHRAPYLKIQNHNFSLVVTGEKSIYKFESSVRVRQ
jgi:hypothetical protein